MPIINRLLRRALAAVDDQVMTALRTIRTHVADEVRFTVQQAAGWLGVSESSVKRRLTPLIQAGLVEADLQNARGGRGKAIEYWLTGRHEAERADYDMPEDLWKVPGATSPTPATPAPSAPVAPTPPLPPPAVLPSDPSEGFPDDWWDPEAPPEADPGILV